MKRSDFLRLIVGGAGALSAIPRARGEAPKITAPVNPPPPARDRSLQLEIEHAIDKGIHSLVGKQDSKGFWSTPEVPGLTALVLTALVQEPTGVIKAQQPDFVKKGYDYLLQCQQPDGGIYLKGLANYSTSVCVLALLAADPVANERVLKRARMFLIGLQGHYPPGSEGEVYDGGIGYDAQDVRVMDPNAPMPPPAVTTTDPAATAPKVVAPAAGLHYDLSNTSFALEALHQTRHLSDEGAAAAKDLNWAAAIGFIQRCQHLPKYNQQAWVKSDAQNLGGFVYDPLNKKGILAYGSMSYDGLLSYIHADLKKDDPRVTAVLDWLRHTYTLEENPGKGPDGLYYYYHMMAKALTAYGDETLATTDGKKVDWASELALKLINLQQTDGSWVNSSGRWWEKDPVLVTTYSVRTLEMLHSQV